jgi:hypothetical protein
MLNVSIVDVACTDSCLMLALDVVGLVLLVDVASSAS